MGSRLFFQLLWAEVWILNLGIVVFLWTYILLVVLILESLINKFLSLRVIDKKKAESEVSLSPGVGFYSRTSTFSLFLKTFYYLTDEMIQINNKNQSECRNRIRKILFLSQFEQNCSLPAAYIKYFKRHSYENAVKILPIQFKRRKNSLIKLNNIPTL